MITRSIQLFVIQLDNFQLALHVALIINAKRYIFSILMNGLKWIGLRHKGRRQQCTVGKMLTITTKAMFV